MRVLTQCVSLTLGWICLCLSLMQPGIEASENLLAKGELRTGEVKEERLVSGEAHEWKLMLNEGDFAVVNLTPVADDARIRVIMPDGEVEGIYDNPPWCWDGVFASWIAETTGSYTLRIEGPEEIQNGKYYLCWLSVSKGEEADRVIAAALKLEMQALKHLQNREYEEAEDLYRRTLSMRESARGEDHADVADGLQNLAYLCGTPGRHSEAENLYGRLLRIREKVQGADHPSRASGLFGLAHLYRSQGRFSKAELLYEEALKIREKTTLPDERRLAAILHGQAVNFVNQGKYSEARPAFERSLELDQKVRGSDHPAVASSLHGLANLCALQSDYEEAERLYQRALEITEKLRRKDPVNLAQIRIDMARMYSDQGRYDEAESLFRWAFVALEEKLGSKHRFVTRCRTRLADLYSAKGEYARSIPLYRQVLAINEELLGPEHPAVAGSLENLALIYRNHGRYSESENAYRKALDIRRKTLDASHPSLSSTLYDLGIACEIQGKLPEAESLLKESLHVYENADPWIRRTPGEARVLNSLAQLYLNQGRLDEAKPLVARSLSIMDDWSERDQPSVSLALVDQARVAILKKGGGGPEALSALEKAIEILLATGGFPETRSAAHELRAQIRKEKGDLPGAISDLAESLRLVEEMRPSAGGGERARAGFFQRYSDSYDRMVDWQLDAGDIESAIEYFERGRARVLLDQLAAGRIDLRSSIPAEIRDSLENREREAHARLTEYQCRISLAYSAEELSTEERSRKITLLREQLREAYRVYQEIDEEFKNASPLWRDMITSGGQPVRLTTIQDVLVPREGLLLLYKLGRERSHLLVIPPSQGQVQVVSLTVSKNEAVSLGIDPGPLNAQSVYDLLMGESAESKAGGLMGTIQKGARGVRVTTSGPLQNPFARLHALWKVLLPGPLWERVRDSREVVVIPDGALHSLPFELLMIEAQESAEKSLYWLDEGPPIRYAPSASSLYNITRRPKSRLTTFRAGSSVLSLSDPVFSLVDDPASLLASKEALPTPVPKRFSSDGGSIPRLPGTARESEAIRQAFEDEGLVGEVEILARAKATELALREAVQEKTHIHLATHGLVDEKGEYLFASLALSPPAKGVHTPNDDGLLQLFEIYDLKLPECELAVLSACETHAGRYVKGEGIFALSRGFLVAGARRVVASQWSVDDESTAKLMGDFFGLLAEEEKAARPANYTAALHDAKKRIRAQDRWSHPYYWAPFILIGKQ